MHVSCSWQCLWSSTVVVAGLWWVTVKKMKPITHESLLGYFILNYRTLLSENGANIKEAVHVDTVFTHTVDLHAHSLWLLLEWVLLAVKAALWVCWHNIQVAALEHDSWGSTTVNKSLGLTKATSCFGLASAKHAWPSPTIQSSGLKVLMVISSCYYAGGALKNVSKVVWRDILNNCF